MPNARQLPPRILDGRLEGNGLAADCIVTQKMFEQPGTGMFAAGTRSMLISTSRN